MCRWHGDKSKGRQSKVHAVSSCECCIANGESGDIDDLIVYVVMRGNLMKWSVEYTCHGKRESVFGTHTSCRMYEHCMDMANAGNAHAELVGSRRFPDNLGAFLKEVKWR
eukprot:scaffold203982_cov18-Tisochrysis_lutea.AAC.1